MEKEPNPEQKLMNVFRAEEQAKSNKLKKLSLGLIQLLPLALNAKVMDQNQKSLAMFVREKEK